MKFKTKLWKRKGKSFATTIPQVVCSFLDLSKKYEVEWRLEKDKWYLELFEEGTRKKEGMAIFTKLWQRSQRSYATTIPLAVLLHIDEKKDYNIIWEHSQGKWKIEVKA